MQEEIKMRKKHVLLMLFAVLLFSPVFANCIAGWACKDAFHRAYRDCNCDWAFVEHCPHGCISGVCTQAPNTPPAIPEVNISPDPATASNTLECHAHSTDPNAYQNIEYEYKWYRNDDFFISNTSTSETDTLSSEYTHKGDKWMCKVRAYDQADYSNYGYDEIVIGSGQACTAGWICKDCCTRAYQNEDCSLSNEEACINGCSQGVCLGAGSNHPPTDPTVEITPSSPNDNDNVSCRASSSDADNDNIEYHFTWKKNGSVFRTVSTYANYNTVDASYTSQGDEWQCMVRAWDGQDYSGYSADVVTIGGSGCNFDLSITPEYSTLHMERNGSRSISVRIKNNSCERTCFDLSSASDSSYINSSVSVGSACLSAGESTTVALSIETIDASAQTYNVRLRARSGTREKSTTVQVMVDSCTGCNTGNCIELVAYSKNICLGKKEKISILVKNNSDEIKTVSMSASSTEFLASFDNSKTEVDSHSQKYVYLNVYVYPGTSLGSHYINVFAQTDNDSVKKKAYFNVKECEEPEENSFSVTMSGSCQPIEKGKDLNMSFSVKNRTDNELTVSFQTVADIPSQVPASITLAPQETKTVEFNVKARESDETGKHYIKLYAWTPKFRVMKTACVEIEKKRKTVISLQENNLEIEQCRNNVFVLFIENRGDYNESYKIEVNNSTRASVTLSEKEISLKPGEAKQVFVNVDVPLDMNEGKYSFDVLIKNKETFTKKLIFSVVRAKTPAPTTIALTSYPATIVLLPGEEKTISIAVSNLTMEKVDGINIEWSLPSFLYAENGTISVEPQNTTIIEQAISTSPEAVTGTYYGWLSLNIDNTKVTKKITVVIVEPKTVLEPETTGEEGKKPGFWGTTGLFALANPLEIGLIILLTIVIIMVALKGIIESDTDYSKPVWHRR